MENSNRVAFSIGLVMDTICGEPNGDKVSEAIVPATIPKVEHIQVLPTYSQAPNIAAETQPTLIASLKNVTIESKDIGMKKLGETQMIKCPCGDNEDDLDMIQCDKCGFWQHTPCAGYCSNRDKRIPKDNYNCYFCQYGTSKKIIFFFKDLSSFRRAIAILFTDGIKGIKDLTERLSCSYYKANVLVQRLESEGLLTRIADGGKGFAYKPCTGSDVKSKLSHYFGPDPSTFKGFPGKRGRVSAQQDEGHEVPGKAETTANCENEDPKLKRAKRRKSETSQKIDA